MFSPVIGRLALWTCEVQVHAFGFHRQHRHLLCSVDMALVSVVSDTIRFRKQSCKTILARSAKLVPTCMCHFVSAPLYHDSLTPDWPSHLISAMPKKSSLAHQTKMEKDVCQAYHGFPFFNGGGRNRQSVFSMRANTGRHNNPSSANCASLYSEVRLRYVSYLSRLLLPQPHKLQLHGCVASLCTFSRLHSLSASSSLPDCGVHPFESP